MPKIKLYIAATIDGFIAREDGSLDWLNNHPNPDQLDYGYADFMSRIDTVIMGRKTYEEVLGFGVEWPYGSLRDRLLGHCLRVVRRLFDFHKQQARQFGCWIASEHFA